MITPGTRRWWALGALALSLLAVGLDATVLNIALPTLATALHASTGQLQWFVDAYSLVFAAVLLPAGMLGDRFGRKKLLLIALAVFGIGSLACAFAPSANALIAARVLLGMGGAFLIPLSVAVLPVLFGEEERPRAIAVWVAANAVSFPIGPIVGGWLLTNFWWGSVFLINVPVVVLAIAAVTLLLPESRSSERRPLDLAGVLLSSAGLAGVTYGVIEAGEKSWGDPAAAGALAIGLVLLGAFAFWQRRTRFPLVDLALFRSAGFTWGSILATVVSFAMFGVLFVVPQYFQGVLGTDALGSGLRLLPVMVGLLAGSQLANRAVGRVGAKVTVALGFALLTLGLGLGAAGGVGSGYGFAAAWITVIGLGLGFSLPVVMDAAVAALTPERSGVGSALMMALRQVGGTLGVAVLGTILDARYRDGVDVAGLPPALAETVKGSVAAGVAVATQLHSGALLQSVQRAFVSGMDGMLEVCAGMMVLGMLVALVFLPRGAERAAGNVEPAEEGQQVIA